MKKLQTYIRQVLVSLNRYFCRHKRQKIVIGKRDRIVQYRCEDCGKISYKKN